MKWVWSHVITKVLLILRNKTFYNSNNNNIKWLDSWSKGNTLSMAYLYDMFVIGA